MYAFSRLENEMSELYFDFFSFLSLFQKKKNDLHNECTDGLV